MKLSEKQSGIIDSFLKKGGYIMKTCIQCGWLFTSENEQAQKDMEVIIEDNVILSVGKMGSCQEEGMQVIDLRDKFVMPGLIDAHTHIVLNGPLDTSAVYQMLPGDALLCAMENAQKDMQAGFTTLRDVSSIDYVDVSLRNAIQQKRVTGPRLMVSGMMLSSTGGHIDSHFVPQVKGAALGYVVNSPDEARKAARLNFKYGADILKLAATGGVMSMGDAPGSVDLTYEEMKAAIDIAKAHGRTSSAHAHGAEGIKNAIRAGITSIEHGMLVDEEGMQMMAEHGTYLIPTIIAAHRIVEGAQKGNLASWMVKKAEECLENHERNLSRMRELGVKVGFGSDVGTTFNYHGEQGLEFALMTEAGFRPAETLLAATKVNAELMGLDDQIGTIQTGKLADIVAFDKNPLEDIRAMQACTFVMRDGIVYKG